MIKSAMPPQIIPPFPAGSNSIYTAGIKTQQNNAQLQNALAQHGGIKRRRRTSKRTSRRTSKRRTSRRTSSRTSKKRTRNNKRTRTRKGGGVPLVQVPPVPSSSSNNSATVNNYASITKLAMAAQQGALFDNAKTPSQVSALAAKQDAMYQGK